MKINKFIRRNKYLIIIIFISFLLRLYKLGSIPPSLTPDEAALGYNAYSIIKTLRDEHGQLLPVVFKSFGDFKPGLYIYISVPFVLLMGLSEFSTRIAGSLAGIVGIFIFYQFVKAYLTDLGIKSKGASVFAALSLALSPWHLLLSRGAWEVNLAFTLSICGALLLIKSLHGKYNLLYFSAIMFALSLLTYQGAKITSIMLIFSVLASYSDKVEGFPRGTIFKSLLLGIVISFPILISLFNGSIGRLSVFSLFSSPRPQEITDQILSESGEKEGSLSYYLFHSQPLNFVRGILGRWFNHYSANFLFFEGDYQNPRHSAPYSGVLLLSDLPLLLAGLIYFSKNKISRRSLFVVLTALLSPLPASLTRDQVHAVRAYYMIIPLAITSTLGFYFLYTNFRRKFLFVFVPIFIFSIVMFMDKYYIHLPKGNSKYWEYGYEEVAVSVMDLRNKYKKIVVQQSYAQPYIYFLFYGNKYNDPLFSPANYIRSFSNSNFIPSSYGDVGLVSHIGNIEFKYIDWQVLRGEKGALVVADTLRIPPGDSAEGADFGVIKEIKYLDEFNTAFRVVEIKEDIQ